MKRIFLVETNPDLVDEHWKVYLSENTSDPQYPPEHQDPWYFYDHQEKEKPGSLKNSDLEERNNSKRDIVDLYYGAIFLKSVGCDDSSVDYKIDKIGIIPRNKKSIITSLLRSGDFSIWREMLPEIQGVFKQAIVFENDITPNELINFLKDYEVLLPESYMSSRIVKLVSKLKHFRILNTAYKRTVAAKIEKPQRFSEIAAELNDIKLKSSELPPNKFINEDNKGCFKLLQLIDTELFRYIISSSSLERKIFFVFGGPKILIDELVEYLFNHDLVFYQNFQIHKPRKFQKHFSCLRLMNIDELKNDQISSVNYYLHEWLNSEKKRSAIIQGNPSSFSKFTQSGFPSLQFPDRLISDQNLSLLFFELYSRFNKNEKIQFYEEIEESINCAKHNLYKNLLKEFSHLSLTQMIDLIQKADFGRIPTDRAIDWYQFLESIPSHEGKASVIKEQEKKVLKKYEFIHPKEERFWVIKIDGSKVDQVKYLDNICMKYMIFILRFAKGPKNKIRAKDIIDRVIAWHGKDMRKGSGSKLLKNGRMHPDAKPIYKKLNMLKNQFPFLEEVVDCIRLDKECYWNASNKFEVVIDDPNLKQKINTTSKKK